MDWLEIIKLVIAGLIGGLISPVINWSIEKRRGKRLYQQSSIQRWRESIDQIDGWYIGNSFQDISIYSEIKPFLGIEVRQKFEIPRNTLTLKARPGIAVEGISTKQILLDDIVRIEREVWHLY